MNGVFTESIQGRHSLLISSISPSMDEAATKEELRLVKQLEWLYLSNASLLLLSVSRS